MQEEYLFKDGSRVRSHISCKGALLVLFACSSTRQGEEVTAARELRCLLIDILVNVACTTSNPLEPAPDPLPTALVPATSNSQPSSQETPSHGTPATSINQLSTTETPPCAITSHNQLSTPEAQTCATTSNNQPSTPKVPTCATTLNNQLSTTEAPTCATTASNNQSSTPETTPCVTAASNNQPSANETLSCEMQTTSDNQVLLLRQNPMQQQLQILSCHLPKQPPVKHQQQLFPPLS